ncbi:2Fe-2S iron-sulfur cluster-binding protein [Gordonia aichiensis]|uniref:Putative 2Fe-2S ferredoxin n=1 Tax=Gordonia aichiensis NBRC 108223 TaxID=1220583 RepID=L7KKN9_9ACTN|nr:2Fe-2S iron-sulfur cluster-binding protein [Gordonia aichiensis]GAC49179.1 putative 2Fe-2S ferredoxin [Gordonia aichiensis NBRC 108223]
MPLVAYHLPDGTVREIEVPPGQSLMAVSTQHNLPGIVAECGGNCSCATCHVSVDPEYAALFSEPSDEERELIEFSDDACATSRLSCQLIAPDTDQRIEVRVFDSR